MYCQLDVVRAYMDEFKNTVKTSSWEKSYSYRIDRFFSDYLSQDEHKDRSLMAITENEVNNFISSLPFKHNEKVNYYRVLKKFFDYLARKEVVQPFYVKVKKLTQEHAKPKYINNDHIQKIVNFINSDAKIEHRLLLALFLYTGLSRSFIVNLTFQQISEDITFFQFNNGKTKIPIKEELRGLLWEYKRHRNKKEHERVFEISESTMSIEVKYISKNACGFGYSPTEFSSTFIIKALGDEEKWTNLYTVSRLTLESISTIEKHIVDTPPWLIEEQKKLLKEWNE